VMYVQVDGLRSGIKMFLTYNDWWTLQLLCMTGIYRFPSLVHGFGNIWEHNCPWDRQLIVGISEARKLEVHVSILAIYFYQKN
jgi:hypothetical protein